MEYPWDYGAPDMGGFPNGGVGEDDGQIPNFDMEIHEYNGECATDANSDTVGEDKDFYWEANSFTTKVKVVYDGATAKVSCDNDDVIPHVDNAHVVLDMQTNSVSGVEIDVSGKSDDGSLKIYGGNKFKLTLSGVDLTSRRGAVINSQCKKRIFVHLAENAVNSLTDAAEYSDDMWYIDALKASDEDRKGAFFSEGHLIFSGSGTLRIAGKHKHGIATDGYMFIRPGVTIAVAEAAKNAVHVKGDNDDGIGIRMMGGLLYANVASDAGKAVKTDLNVEVTGGTLDLNTSGKAIYDSDEKDTSSPAGIKADGNITIAGGTVSIKSTGIGGKGMNADGDIAFFGGKATIVTTGGKYRYSSALTSSPKGVKADGNIIIGDASVNVSVVGASDGSEGLESKSVLTINGGETYVYAYDDAINAETGIAINGGKTYAYSSNNDGIDSNGYLHINGGLVIAAGASGAEESLDCEVSSQFLINGGTVIGTGGTYMTTPSSSSKQRTILYSGISASNGDKIAILDSSDKPLMVYTVPRSMNSMVLFFSSSSLLSGASYSISKGGSISGYDSSWNGWYDGGEWSGGSSIGTFTSNNVITTAGNAGGGMGGGQFPGGTPPGR